MPERDPQATDLIGRLRSILGDDRDCVSGTACDGGQCTIMRGPRDTGWFKIVVSNPGKSGEEPQRHTELVVRVDGVYAGFTKVRTKFASPEDSVVTEESHFSPDEVLESFEESAGSRAVHSIQRQLGDRQWIAMETDAFFISVERASRLKRGDYIVTFSEKKHLDRRNPHPRSVTFRIYLNGEIQHVRGDESLVSIDDDFVDILLYAMIMEKEPEVGLVRRVVVGFLRKVLSVDQWL